MNYSVYDDLLKISGKKFDVIIALEVIEHLFFPRVLLKNSRAALTAGGQLFLSTPYHGYCKNLAISILGGWDKHFTVDWDGGHIKFYSPSSLEKQLHQAGFSSVKFNFAGRMPLFWKSMICQASSPTAI
jgi:2-polyprenyl-3-methyl-5-hydroxy-6-metoxy-1,4-benzoquinol methylase